MLIAGVLACLFLSAFAASDKTSSVRTPAQWEPQESIWLAWPELEPVKSRSNIPQILDMMAAVTPYEFIDLIVNNNDEEQLARTQIIKHRINISRVRFHMIQHTDFWMRDVGAIFVLNDQGQREAIVPHFNNWGMGAVSKGFNDTAKIDSKISGEIAKQLHIPTIHSFLTLEGGGLEFNGKGTLIITEAVILQPQRNPGLTKEKAEAELKRIFGLKKVIWMKHGIRADDSTFYGPIPSQKGLVFTALTTNGHTDEYVRWINDHTVLLAEVTTEEAAKAGPGSIAAITRDRMEQDADILAHATNQDGQPIKIIRIPVAEDIYETLHPGDATFDGVVDMVRADPHHQGMPVFDAQHQKAATFVSATSYLNYLVTNKVVLMAKYWQPGYPEVMRQKDEAAKAIIQAAFPDRKVVQIANVEDINIGGGGIHCITQQMPAAGVIK